MINTLKKYYKRRKADVEINYLVLMIIGLVALVILAIILFKSKLKMDDIVETFRGWFG
ncbi:TPA: hypothetical protein HA246_02340 [Candidatus Woesearchaeota archaeon]|nr:hypothetical protein [Candidatus Woesearchaeota archaeon]